MAALELAGLSKSYGQRAAADQVWLTVPHGCLLGLFGPHGAGKTTSLSMAVGLLRPDAGTARVHGIDVWTHPQHAKSLLGVLPDAPALPERLTGGELLTYWGRLRGIDSTVVTARTTELLKVLELAEADAAGALVVEYTAGMRRKLGLASALLHRPRVLVLDEPFEAVDVRTARVLTTILRRFVRAGGSVLLSSHVMATVEQLCDRVAIIAGGRVLADGTLAQVRGHSTLTDTLVRLVGVHNLAEEDLAWLR